MMVEEKNCKNEDEKRFQNLAESVQNGSYKLLEYCGHDSNQENIIFSRDTLCGIGAYRPRWLQPFASVKIYTILYSILGILHSSYYSYLVGTLSTLEKRFAFKSKTSGIIFIADEMAPIFLGVIIGYYAGKTNRLRIITFGMVLSVLCNLFSSFPYFIYGPVQHLKSQSVVNEGGPQICDPFSNKESCDVGDQPPSLTAFSFLVFGSFLKGFSNIAYYAIGLIYLDDNSEKKNTPLYLGKFFLNCFNKCNI